MLACLIALVVLAVTGASAIAQESKFHVTAEERAACSPDALRLCSDTYPDEDRLLVCMKAKREQLSATCRPVFEAGIKRRHL